MIKAFWDFAVGLVAFIALLGFAPMFIERLATDSAKDSVIIVPIYIAFTIFVIVVPAYRLGIAATHILVPGKKRNADSL